MQTYSDFELLIVDDGSTDKTAEIVTAKAAHDARIRLIRRVNAGVSSARNAGIDAASGELLCFVDSDDTVSANYLEILHALYRPGVLPVIDVVRSDGKGSALSYISSTYVLNGDWVDSYFCGQLRYGIAFSASGKAVYVWYSGTGYLVRAAVSPDGKYLAALCLQDSGSVVHTFSLTSEDERGSAACADELFADLFWRGGKVCCVSQTRLAFFDDAAKLTAEYPFGDLYL